MIKKRLIKLLSHSQKYIAYQVAWMLLSLLSQIMLVFTLAHLLEQALFSQLNTRAIVICAAIILAGVAMRFLCERKITKASYYASRDVKVVLRKKIYEKLLRLGTSYKAHTSTSEVVQMAAEGVEQLEIYFGRYLSQFIYSLLAPIILCILLCFVNVKASLVLLICVPLIPIAILSVNKFAKRLLSKYWGIYTGLGDSFLENLQGLTTLKIYQADSQKSKQMDQQAQNFRKITMRVLTMQLNSTSVMDIIAYGGAAAGMIVVLGDYFAGNVGFSGALIIILLAAEFFLPLRLLGSYFHIAMNGMAASDKIFALLDIEEPPAKTLILQDQKIDIQMQGINFSYEDDRQVLQSVNLEFPAGSFTSLVGASGCGKSTIAQLLMGRNYGYDGSILLNQMELSTIEESSLMQNITFVSHHSYLFKGSVSENLRMAKADATQNQMIEALRQVNLWEFLQAQGGLEAVIKEKGSNLSGGQCQRLALARALLHDSQVYIFDEATSNIDIESEELIMSVIHELSKTKTIILISHRLANVVNSDKIYMLQDGIVAEEGKHQDLMRIQGLYYKLYDIQAKLESYGKAVV